MPRVYGDKDVLTAARERIAFTFDNFERIFVAFSGGKDSSVMLHLVMDEAIVRGRTVGVMYIDFEAQYDRTAAHIAEMFEMYRDNIDPHWITMPMLLRNAVTNFEPRWMCWDPDKRDLWIREMPEGTKRVGDYPFALPGLEFEEFVVLFGEWYGQGQPCAGFIGIRAQESLNRYMAIATWEKRGLTFQGKRWTTKVVAETYNAYPIYDWKSEDIWRYHAANPDKPHNTIYDLMQMAGVPLSQQRLCQPFGDDQRRGLWLYHILEPQTWGKLVARVSGANSGARYIEESGNITGYRKISKPEGHTWRSYTNLLLQTMPKTTRDHYVLRMRKFIYGWRQRGYAEIPDEVPPELEARSWAPSWRRMAKVLLRNDWWCHGLGQSQPRSEAYQRYLAMRGPRTRKQVAPLRPVAPVVIQEAIWGSL
jgi:predicted phosphoadenosine phosphosulfate sulfurtransferase